MVQMWCIGCYGGHYFVANKWKSGNTSHRNICHAPGTGRGRWKNNGIFSKLASWKSWENATLFMECQNALWQNICRISIGVKNGLEENLGINFQTCCSTGVGNGSDDTLWFWRVAIYIKKRQIHRTIYERSRTPWFNTTNCLLWFFSRLSGQKRSGWHQGTE